MQAEPDAAVTDPAAVLCPCGAAVALLGAPVPVPPSGHGDHRRAAGESASLARSSHRPSVCPAPDPSLGPYFSCLPKAEVSNWDTYSLPPSLTASTYTVAKSFIRSHCDWGSSCSRTCRAWLPGGGRGTRSVQAGSAPGSELKGRVGQERGLVRTSGPCARKGRPRGFREKGPPDGGPSKSGALTCEEEQGQGQHQCLHPG